MDKLLLEDIRMYQKAGITEKAVLTEADLINAPVYQKGTTGLSEAHELEALRRAGIIPALEKNGGK